MATFDLSDPRYKVLKSNAVYDKQAGRIVGTVGPNPHAITKENAHLLKRKRQEKAAAILRKRITEATNAVSTINHKGSASAIADVGGMLFSEIVLNPDAYPRDRMEAFEKLGKMAEIIPDGKDKADDPGQAAAGFFTAAAALLKQMQEHIAPSEPAVEGLVLESGISALNVTRNDAHSIEPGTAGELPAGEESEDE